MFNEALEYLNPHVRDIMETLISWSEKADLASLLGLGKPRTKLMRRISVKPDREGKSRIFAIIDYWTQTALTPLHDHLYDLLKKIPEDCTKDQMSGVKKMLMYKSRKWFYSYDLTSATDRFPVVIQERILGMMFDTNVAEA
jgi:hypothetical protein